MNKRQIEFAKKAAQNVPETAADKPLQAGGKYPHDNDNALLLRFYTARLACVNTLTRMDGAEKQMRSALSEARIAVKVWKEGIEK